MKRAVYIATILIGMACGMQAAESASRVESIAGAESTAAKDTTNADSVPVKKRTVSPMAYRLLGAAGMIMPDGKVDPFVQRPVLGGSFAVEFLPTGKWHCLQQWNNASIGVGVSYLNLGNDQKLGSAFALYGYMNQPFYTGKHFGIGLRPSVGVAAISKRYANTYEGTSLYKDHVGANWSIGSILNAYLALQLYMDFPIKDGWAITVNGGWQHMSNGSVMHPNAGYNIFGGEVGVRYQPSAVSHQPSAVSHQSPEPDVPRKLYDGVDKPWAVELSATGGMKQNYYADNQNGQQWFGAATVKVAAYWVPVSIFRVGLGVDGFYDGYYRCVSALKGADYSINYPDAPKTYFGKTYLYESNVKNCFRVGISIQPEFIIGRLTAGLHVGFYVFDPVKNLEPYSTITDTNNKNYDPNALHPGDEPFNRGIFYGYDFTKASNYEDGWCYMQFVLKYHVLDHMFVQLGLKTHGVRAEFIDAGLGVAF